MLHEGQFLHGKGHFSGFSDHSEALAFCAAVFAAKEMILSSIMACSRRNYSVLSDRMTCHAAFRPNSLTSCLVNVLLTIGY